MQTMQIMQNNQKIFSNYGSKIKNSSEDDNIIELKLVGEDECKNTATSKEIEIKQVVKPLVHLQYLRRSYKSLFSTSNHDMVQTSTFKNGKGISQVSRFITYKAPKVVYRSPSRYMNDENLVVCPAPALKRCKSGPNVPTSSSSQRRMNKSVLVETSQTKMGKQMSIYSTPSNEINNQCMLRPSRTANIFKRHSIGLDFTTEDLSCSMSISSSSDEHQQIENHLQKKQEIELDDSSNQSKGVSEKSSSKLDDLFTEFLDIVGDDSGW